MKLNKTTSLDGIKTLLWSILHFFLFELFCIGLELLANIGIKPTGDTNGSGFLPLTEYKLNLFFTVTACILFIIIFTVFYTKFLRKDIKKIFKCHWIFIILFILTYLLLGYVGFIAFLFITIYKVGLFSTVVNEPIILYQLIFIYVIGFILTDIIKLIIKFIKKRKK